MSDHAVAVVLALGRRLVALDRLVRGGGWGADRPGKMRRLDRQTVGLIGFGAIGRLTAQKARALGMRVLVYSPNTTAVRAAERGAEAADRSKTSSGTATTCACMRPLTPRRVG